METKREKIIRILEISGQRKAIISSYEAINKLFEEISEADFSKMKIKIPLVLKLLVDKFEERLTETEIDELLNLYTTPTYQLFLKTTEELGGEIGKQKIVDIEGMLFSLDEVQKMQ